MSDTSRMSSIAYDIHAALAPMLAADKARDSAKDALDVAKGGAANAREAIMDVLAAASIAGSWTHAEIEGAAKLAGQLGTNAETPKAVATFLGEAKKAMHPMIRGYFADFVAVRNQAWDAEAEAKAIDADAEQPIKKAFQRKYHVLVTMMGEAIGGCWIETADELVAFAVSRDPDLDAGKIAKRLDKILADLHKFNGDFPVGDIQEAIEKLSGVSKETLAAARDKKLGLPVREAIGSARPSRPAKPAATPVVAAAPAEVAPAEVAPAEGASDMLDEIMSDFQGGAHAAVATEVANLAAAA